MKGYNKIIYAVIIILVGVLVLAGLLLISLSCAGRSPEVGLMEGRLRPCPDRPNCVCSEDGEIRAWTKPLVFHGSAKRAWEQLQIAIKGMGGEIQRHSDTYMWATFTTKVFRFVDDMEFRMVDDESIIHVRSASRVGYSDLGLNRRRVEKLRSRFSKSLCEHDSSDAKGDGQRSE